MTNITIKTVEEIQIMREGGKILAQIMEEIKLKVKPGITTNYLNKVAEDLIFGFRAKPSFKGYQGFPTALCTSINEEIVHGAPSSRVLKEGDIISLDLGIFYMGFHTDMAVTVGVEEISPEAQYLLRITKKALKRAIKNIREGNTTGAIGNAIQRYVEKQGFDIVRDLCGHGIGRNIHEEPQILNYGKRRAGAKLVENMVICPEPMVVLGKGKIKQAENGFAFETVDGSLSAHFEHTVAVTKQGFEILTKI
ncbi:MAG: type I methionyl aminopeptidase [Candidatus Pacebacteria bacterium]|nr:type I methionyl aminopeptidase [Candidatus Paceibacterota bacterium]